MPKSSLAQIGSECKSSYILDHAEVPYSVGQHYQDGWNAARVIFCQRIEELIEGSPAITTVDEWKAKLQELKEFVDPFID